MRLHMHRRVSTSLFDRAGVVDVPPTSNVGRFFENPNVKQLIIRYEDGTFTEYRRPQEGDEPCDY